MGTRANSNSGVQLAHLPIFLMIFGLAALSMLVPAVHATAVGDQFIARTYLYSALLGMITFALIALAHAGRKPRHGTLGPLMSLFSALVFLPVILAVPFYEAGPPMGRIDAYVEMVSAITTTGATVFEDPGYLSGSLHLWRAQVGWMGGLLMWVAASAILAPLNLGGFEVTARAEPGRRVVLDMSIGRADLHLRLRRALGTLVPVYVGLTLLLWTLLIITGDRPLVALCHAMSVMATSGISPVGGLGATGSGVAGEAVMLLFMLFALSRLTFTKDTTTSDSGGLQNDPEFRMGLALMIGVPVALFLRHWVGAFEFSAEDSLVEAARAFWGAFFTVTSFLTTTGFASVDWVQAQSWSGLETPGIILMGLALIGGGVATTAGGVKLLRVFALYQIGLREMERLVYPSSVSSAGALGRRLQSNGAFIAWIFFMLFALTFALLTVLFAAFGVDFDTAMILSISGLSTTGPLLQVAGDAPIVLDELGTGAKSILAFAMVLGRLETLAIIALLTPSLWRA